MQAGERFARLVALKRIGTNKWRSSIWLFRCDCGKRTKGIAGAVKAGQKRSCGCLHHEHPGPAIKHGRIFTSEYRSWANMLARCRDLSDLRYGGRKIKVCKRWFNFENFFADMGEKPTQKHQLDRKDNNKGYSPSNCRWATSQQQARNRRSNRIVRIHGRKMTHQEACDLVGIKWETAYQRIKRGWSIERAFTP